KRIAHDARVVGIQDAVERRLAARERREEQRAVGDALRAGQPHAPCCAFDFGKESRVHGYSVPAGRLGPAAQAVRVARASVISRSRPEASPRSIRSRKTARRAPYRSISASSASLFCIEMSRHICGELAAMRVKSRKPPAAKPRSSAAFSREAISET